MNGKTNYERIIFGLKVKQARQSKRLSFSDLSKLSGLSISYLNEIEKGKKFPKEDKIESLSKALGEPVDKLKSQELNPALAPVSELLKSNFLNELPLDLFGIDLAKVVELIANAPARVSAFISTLLELSRNYALNESSFYFGALRAYLQLHNHYFDDLEEAVDEFIQIHGISTTPPISQQELHKILEEVYGYTIVENGLEKYPELSTLRSIFLAKNKVLLLSERLNETQKSFQLGKELGFQFLNLKERASTSSLLRTSTFEEVLNHSKAIYFSVALHIQKAPLIEELRHLFNQSNWDGIGFLRLLSKFRATPEMLYHRLTNVLPRFFGMKNMFFLRFIHDPKSDTFEVDRELHLTARHFPHRNGLNEHYCRRWVSISLLKDLYYTHQLGKNEPLMVQAQRSTYLGTGDEYLCITVARTSYPAPNQNVSVTVGLLINDHLKSQIKFLNDPAIKQRDVNITCERCEIADCDQRAAPPIVIEKKRRFQEMQKAIKALEEK